MHKMVSYLQITHKIANALPVAGMTYLVQEFKATAENTEELK